MTDNYLHSEITAKILKAFYNVYNILGYGFLEKVYENAMMIELQAMGLFCEQQKHLKVLYKGHEIGDYYADILVERKVIVELKAAESLCPDHEAQLVHYLRSTELEVGQLLNFGRRPQHIRRVLTNDYKHHKKS
jgi:GxxExxY protein